ncbi:MAG: endolytic transglycosylase MltG, partial [Candidatus Zixiibacteriota bacterium]
KKLFLGLFVIVVFLIAGTYIFYAFPFDMGKRVVSVVVKPGDSFSVVADTLVARKVIHGKPLLKAVARWMHLDRSLTPGRYDFTGKNSIATVLAKLARADFVRVKLTVYEGAPIWKTAEILSRALHTDSAALVALNHDSAFLARLDLPCLEGYLFPQTYFLAWGTPLETAVEAMVAMFHQQTDSLLNGPLPGNLTREQVVTLASIIQAEALLPEEMPVISSVYHNRLRRGMKLQADPTVLYGLGDPERPLSRRDLRTDTPYNTYLHKGLPPTPINSPGLAAIQAALRPDSTSYLYFVADGTGHHVFSRTNAEHNRARRRIRRAAHR